MVFKNVGAAVAKYVTLRDSLTEWSRKKDAEEQKRKKKLEEIEMWLLQQSEALGVDSFKTEYGTAYKSMEEHYRIQDWNQVLEYVKRTDNFQVFQKRVTKTAVKEIQTETGELPDGLDYFTEFKMHVRRPTRKSNGKEE